MAEGGGDVCQSCGANFHKKQKGWARRSLESSYSTDERKPIEIIETCLKVSLKSPDKKGFLCLDCSKSLQLLAKGKRLQESARASLVSGEGSIAKRIRSQCTPTGTPRKAKWRRMVSPIKRGRVSGFTTKSQTKTTTRKTDRTHAFDYFKKGKHKTGLRLLLKNSFMKKAFTEVFSDMVGREMTYVVRKKDSWLRQDASLENLENFTWHKAMQELKNDCPLLISVLMGSLTSRRNQAKETYGKFKTRRSIAPLVGTVTAMLAYAKIPSKANFFQRLNSLQMWLAGCKRELFSQFNHLHWNVGILSTRKCVDRVVSNYDGVVKTWIQDTEESLKKSAAQIGTMDLDQTLPYADDHPMDMDISPERTGFGFTLCFDNVNQKVGVRHYKKGKSPKMFNMVQLYAARDRIPTLHLDESIPDYTAIENIPVQDILPTETDEDLLRSEMETLVSRTLCEYMPLFNQTAVRDAVTWHIPNEYDELSRKKSEMVPLGVLDKDETKTADMVHVLNHYTQYVPSDPRGNPTPTVLYGDGLSCERGLDAKGAIVNCDTKWTRLEGIEPSVQEWHKRVLLLQDAFDDLYSPKSAKEKGTLYHLKQVFGHKKVSNDVKVNFNHCYEFLTFVTEGYIVLSALHELGMGKIDGMPSPIPPTMTETIQLLHKTSKQIVDNIFEYQNINSVANAHISQKEVDASEFCVCKKENSHEIMIYYDHRKCPNGNWFHLTCIGMDEKDIPEGEWFCCKQCERREKPKKKGKTCVSKSLMDRKREYVRAVIWHGLNSMARRDAIRENDGERMLAHWKLDLMDFFRNNHPKYFILGTILLCQQAGAASERLKPQLKWNRTVNPSGGIGRNIAMDLQMEFFNRDYKESVKGSAGQMTDATIARHSLMVGARKRLTDLYALHMVDMPTTRRQTGTVNRLEDIREMVKVLQPELLFENRSRRYFAAFEDFSHTVTVQHPKKMKARLVKHQQKFAKRREILNGLDE